MCSSDEFTRGRVQFDVVFGYDEPEEWVPRIPKGCATKILQRVKQFLAQDDSCYKLAYRWARWKQARCGVDGFGQEKNPFYYGWGFLANAMNLDEFIQRVIIQITLSTNTEQFDVTSVKTEWDCYGNPNASTKWMLVPSGEIATPSYRRMLQSILEEDGVSSGDPELDTLLQEEEYPTVWHCDICGDHAYSCGHVYEASYRDKGDDEEIEE